MYTTSIYYCCLVACSLLLLPGGEGTKKTLHLIGLYPLSGSWQGGLVARVSMEIALEMINTREDILPGYQLDITWEDTKCKTGPGVDAFFRHVYQHPTKIIVVGAACSSVSIATAAVSQIWNLLQISYASGSPSLSDKAQYPLFFRLSTPRQHLNIARMQLMKDFNWKRVATLHIPIDLYSKITEDLIQRMHEQNMTLITSEIFSNEPSLQIANLKKHDTRIIATGTYVDKAYDIFCEAYKQGMYGPKYVWMVDGLYEDEWWLKDNPAIDCTPEQMTQAVEGLIGTAPTYTYTKEIRGISGLLPSEFQQELHMRLGNGSTSGLNVANIAFDTAWAVALALNTTAQIFKDRGYNRSLEDFTYADTEMAELISQSMFSVSFQGIKGYVTFDKNGESTTSIRVHRIQGGKRYTLGHYNDETKSMEWNSDVQFVWAGGHPPPDSTTYIEQVMYVDNISYMVACLLASLGIALSTAFGTFNIIFRNERRIKMSSPRMNNMILIGCIITYSTVYIQERSHDHITIWCKLRMSALMVGFSVTFGALFAKTWRVYAIFMNQTKKVVIKDEQLFLLMFAIVGVDVIILVVRELTNPLTAVSRQVDMWEVDRGDTVVTSYVWVCASDHDIYIKGIIYTIKGLLLVFGAFLAWQTRKVKIPALNDSQYIGVCIYNVAVLSLLGVVLSFALNDQVVLSYIFTCSIIIFGTTTTQMVIFLPKIIGFKKSQNQVEDDESVLSRTTATKMQFSHDDGQSNEFRDQLKATVLQLKDTKSQLKDKQQEIDALKTQLNTRDNT